MFLKFKIAIYKLWNTLNKKYKSLVYFMLPNIFKIVKNKIEYNLKQLNVQQKTFITGEGKVKIGKNCLFGYKLGGGNYKGSIEIQPRYKDSRIIIGNKVSINNNLTICAANKIIINDNTLIGNNVTILDHEAHGIHPNDRNKIGEIGEVVIGKNVWLGNNVTILKNTIIGDNTIVAVGAVVSGVFPSNVIIGGIPAKIIRKIDV